MGNKPFTLPRRYLGMDIQVAPVKLAVSHVSECLVSTHRSRILDELAEFECHGFRFPIVKIKGPLFKFYVLDESCHEFAVYGKNLSRVDLHTAVAQLDLKRRRERQKINPHSHP